METDLSEYHKGTDGLYYADYIAPNKAETFIGKLVSTEWWHHRGIYPRSHHKPVRMLCRICGMSGGQMPDLSG